MSLGFAINALDILEGAIIDHAVLNDVTKVIETEFGRKYLVEGMIETPSGRSIPVRSVWVKEMKEEIIKFVTLYPI
jgi:hypothetical protein